MSRQEVHFPSPSLRTSPALRAPDRHVGRSSVGGPVAAVTDGTSKRWRPSGGRAGNPVITAAQCPSPGGEWLPLDNEEVPLPVTETLISPEATVTNSSLLQLRPNTHRAPCTARLVSQPQGSVGRLPFCTAQGESEETATQPVGGRAPHCHSTAQAGRLRKGPVQ